MRRVERQSAETPSEQPAGESSVAAAVDPAEMSLLLGRLHELTVGMGKNVDDHTAEMNVINADLSREKEDPSAARVQFVMEVVDKIANANTRLNQQLSLAQSQIVEQSKMLESQMVVANTDALTGIANRRAFDLELDARRNEYLRSGESFSLIMLDVDHFKRFNDEFGHQAGDAVLQNVANILAATVRKNGHVARYGGEEFVVILPNSNIHTGTVVAERIRCAIEESRCEFQGKSLQVTASVGIASITQNETGKELVARADDAVYAAKRQGRNTVSVHNGTGSPQKVVAKAAAAVKSGSSTGRSERDSSSESGSSTTTADSFERDGLLSRFEFIEQLRNQIQLRRHSPASLSVMIVAIDRYTDLNHESQVEGALSFVYSQIESTIRDGDLVARYSPSQFAVILQETDNSQKQIPVKRIRERLAAAAPSSTDAEGCKFSVSVGVSTLELGDDAVRLSKKAEDAAKSALPSHCFLSTAPATGIAVTYEAAADVCAVGS